MDVRFGPYSCTTTVCPRRGPLILLNGVDELGSSVCVVVRDFVPFFYVVLPDAMQTMAIERCTSLCKRVFASLNEVLVRRYEGQRAHAPNGALRADVDPFGYFGKRSLCPISGKVLIVRGFEVVERKLLDGYHGRPQRCALVRVMLPSHVSVCKDLLARPLGMGMSADQAKAARGAKARDAAWMDPGLAAACHGLPQESAMRFCEASGRQNTTMVKGAKRDLGASDPKQGTLDGFFAKSAAKAGGKPGQPGVSALRRVVEARAPSTTQETWAFTCAETNIEVGIRFMQVRGIAPGSWCTVKTGGSQAPYDISNCKHEYEVTPDQVVPSEETSTLPLRVFSFDIETLPRAISGNITQFYRGWDLGARLLTIGVCINVAGAPESQWKTLVLQLDEGWAAREAGASAQEAMPAHVALDGPLSYKLREPVEHDGMPVEVR